MMLRILITYLVCDLERNTKLETRLLSDDKTPVELLLLLECQHAFWAIS